MQANLSLPPIPDTWHHRHLLGLESLTAEEITLILDMAEFLQASTEGGRKKLDVLRGRPSQTSFLKTAPELATAFPWPRNVWVRIRSNFRRAVRAFPRGDVYRYGQDD